ncbi:hypothetical protein BAMBUS_00470 [Brevundimonas phage vB_BpoS-Bambus]|nr:hypothetical protein BAMBUS_00470 [Brevundimonas phage vB_BpoS-Bambus]
MPDTARAERQRLRKEIKALQDRAELTADAFTSFQSSVVSLVFQDVSDEVIEENRDKATFYYEAFLDINIRIGKLTRKLADLSK